MIFYDNPKKLRVSIYIYHQVTFLYHRHIYIYQDIHHLPEQSPYIHIEQNKNICIYVNILKVAISG